MSGELWDAYLPDGRLAGVDLVRGEKIPEEYRHAVAEVFVAHKDGTILLMQRDFNKITYPGYWESTAGGAVLKGETFLQGAERELYEETGIRGTELAEIYTVVTGNAIFKGYFCETDIVKYRVRLQENETMAYKWVSHEEFLRIFDSEEYVDSLRERQKGFVKYRLDDFLKKEVSLKKGTSSFWMRSVGILIKDNHVLMSYDSDRNRYCATGDVIRFGESSTEAAERAISEQTGIKTEVDRLILTQENLYRDTFDTGECHEISFFYLMMYRENGQTPVPEEKYKWVPIERLDEYEIYPEIFQEILPNIPDGIIHNITSPKQNNRKKYILNPDIALRSWRNVPYAYYVKNEKKAKSLNKDEFEVLAKCDGIQEQDRNPIISRMIARGVCRIALAGDTLSEWQKPLVCDNRYFPAMNWMLTGKCNYNCKHCFNAADNAKLQNEFNLKEAYRLIEEAAACGINTISLTGGDPVIHIYFVEILKKIYEQGMFVDEIDTNGFFITRDMLLQMKKFKCVPLMKISFDGIGCQDEYRGREGSEKRTISAIKLCISEGFEVNVRMTVNRYNKDSIIETLKKMDRLGVHKTRLVRIPETARLKKNLKDGVLEIQEYFDCMLDVIREYYELDCNMVLDIGQFVTVYPGAETFVPRAVEMAYGEYKDSIPMFRRNFGEITIGASGNLYACHQLASYYEKPGNILGNVKENGLQTYLQEGRYLEELDDTLKTLTEANSKCAGCKWLHYCGGGSRAEAYHATGDRLGCDVTKCIFFEQGYLDKLRKIMRRYNCTSLIMEEL